MGANKKEEKFACLKRALKGLVLGPEEHAMVVAGAEARPLMIRLKGLGHFMTGQPLGLSASGISWDFSKLFLKVLEAFL